MGCTSRNAGCFLFPTLVQNKYPEVEIVDFDMNFINRLATELQYLTWVLRGEYDSAPDRS